jgi:hypothetical protein
MGNKWRPENWKNPYGVPAMGRKASRWFEAGADAILEALCQGDRLDWDILNDISERLQVEHIKYSDPPEVKEQPKEQLMICPMVKECKRVIADPLHCSSHKWVNECQHDYSSMAGCPACIPYEPEKDMFDVTLADFYMKLNKQRWQWQDKT